MSEEFEGIGIVDYDHLMEPAKVSYHPRPLRDFDVEARITDCGVCGSDIHAVKGHWGPSSYNPTIVGHEIVGIVTAVGKTVKKFRVGQRVAMGPISGSCENCYACEHGCPQNCRESEFTFRSAFGDGSGTQGGYAKYIRMNEEWVYAVPENLESKYVAPLMCGGITGFKPLLRAGVKKGTKVGVCGVGGIGHMSILFAKAMGAEVTAISRSNKKRDVALKLGADHYIAMDSPDFPGKSYEDSLEVIVNTGSTFSKESISALLSTLVPKGIFIFITGPPNDVMLTVPPMLVQLRDLAIMGSLAGSPSEVQYMLEFAAEHSVHPWVEEVDINVENVREVWQKNGQRRCEIQVCVDKL